MKAGLGVSLDGTKPVMEFPVFSFRLNKFSSAIDLAQIDYVLLPDGTKLPVPKQ